MLTTTKSYINYEENFLAEEVERNKEFKKLTNKRLIYRDKNQSHDSGGDQVPNTRPLSQILILHPLIHQGETLCNNSKHQLQGSLSEKPPTMSKNQPGLIRKGTLIFTKAMVITRMSKCT